MRPPRYYDQDFMARGNKQRQGPTLGVRFTAVSVL